VITAISLVFIVYMLFQKEWIYSGLLVGILGFYLLMTYLMQKLTTKRILKRSPLVEQPVLQTYIFKDEDFDVTNIKTYKVAYTDIVRYRKTSQFYLLQSIDRKTYIVDINGFDSDQERLEFHNFIDNKYKTKKRV